MTQFMSKEQENRLEFKVVVDSFGKPDMVGAECLKTLQDAIRLSFNKGATVELMTKKKAPAKKRAAKTVAKTTKR